MKNSMFAFATDLADEGTAVVLDNVQHRAGVDELTLAVAYHDARDIFPHNPSRKVRYLEGGTVFFHPDMGRYEGLPLRPRLSGLARSGDPLGELCEAAGARGMGVNAWIAFLHNDRLGFEQPECTTRNAFGDRYLTDLCPANPDVRAFASTLAADVARYGVSNIFAESLHFHGLGHGYHHERYFEDIGTLGTFLLGLCFCEHCLQAAREAGVDADGVHHSVRGELEHRFERETDWETGEPTREQLERLCGMGLLGYLASRMQTVTSLADEVAAASAGSEVVFMDLSGAQKGFATGQPEGDPAPTIAWQMGVDVSGLAGVCGGVEALGYAADPDRVRTDLAAYLDLIRAPAETGLLLRPMPPDNRDADNLAAKLALARDLGLARTDFYHYGFCRLSALDRVRRALHP